MRRYFYILLFLCLSSCSTYNLPPFAGPNKWFLRDGSALNLVDSMKIDFTGKGSTILSNASNGDYDLNFVVSKEEFDSYSPVFAKYLKDIVKSIPLKTDSIEFILADQFMMLSTGAVNDLLPDYVRRADGMWIVVQANALSSTVQADNELWRNLVIDDSKRQIIVLDRIIRNGHHYVIVYVLQSEKKGVPNNSTFHYNIVDKHNMQSVGIYLEYLLGISVDAMNSSLK